MIAKMRMELLEETQSVRDEPLLLCETFAPWRLCAECSTPRPRSEQHISDSVGSLG